MEEQVDNLLVTSMVNTKTLEDRCRLKEDTREKVEEQLRLEIRKLLGILKDLQDLCRYAHKIFKLSWIW